MSNRTHRSLAVGIALLAAGGVGPAASAQLKQSQPGDRMIQQRDLPLRITESGDWFVAEDLVTKGKQLEIAAPGVRLDLQEHTVDGGIWTAKADGLVVRNGRFVGYAINGTAPPNQATVENVKITGRTDGKGVGLKLGDNAAVSDVKFEPPRFAVAVQVGSDSHVLNSTIVGVACIRGGDRCTVRDATADAFGGEAIAVGSNSLIDACRTRSESGHAAILAGDGSQLLASTAVNAAEEGPGISVASAVRISDCTAAGLVGIEAGAKAVISNCRATGVEAALRALAGSTIQDCTAAAAGGVGIWIEDDTQVLRNVVRKGAARPWAGIAAAGTGNVIDYNQAGDAQVGVYVATSGNAIMRNFVYGAESAFKLADNNKVGEIFDLGGGGTLPAEACDANVIY